MNDDFDKWAWKWWEESTGAFNVPIPETQRAIRLAREAYNLGLNEKVQVGIDMAAKELGVTPLADRPASSMTVRQAFAMAAIQGLLAHGGANPERMTNDALLYSGALIAALEKSP